LAFGPSLAGHLLGCCRPLRAYGECARILPASIVGHWPRFGNGERENAYRPWRNYGAVEVPGSRVRKSL